LASHDVLESCAAPVFGDFGTCREMGRSGFIEIMEDVFWFRWYSISLAGAVVRVVEIMSFG